MRIVLAVRSIPKAERRFHASSFRMHTLIDLFTHSLHTLAHAHARMHQMCVFVLCILGVRSCVHACVFDFVPHLDSVLKLMFIITDSI